MLYSYFNRLGEKLKENIKLSGREEGFTLIEIVIAIVIVGILTAIIVPSIIAYQEQVQNSALKQELQIAGQDITTEALDNDGLLPTYIPNEVQDMLAANAAKSKDGYKHLDIANFVYTYSSDRLHWCIQTDAPIVNPLTDHGKLFLSDTNPTPNTTDCTLDNIAQGSQTPWAPPAVPSTTNPVIQPIQWTWSTTNSADTIGGRMVWADVELDWTGVQCAFVTGAGTRDDAEWTEANGGSHIEYRITLKNSRTGATGTDGSGNATGTWTNGQQIGAWYPGNDTGANSIHYRAVGWYDGDQISAVVETRCVVDAASPSSIYPGGTAAAGAKPVRYPAVPAMTGWAATLSSSNYSISWPALSTITAPDTGPALKLTWSPPYADAKFTCPGNFTPNYRLGITGQTILINGTTNILSPTSATTPAMSGPYLSPTSPTTYTGTDLNAAGLNDIAYSSTWDNTTKPNWGNTSSPSLINNTKPNSDLNVYVYTSCAGQQGGTSSSAKSFISPVMASKISGTNIPLQPPAGGNTAQLLTTDSTRILPNGITLALTRCQTGLTLQYKVVQELPSVNNNFIAWKDSPNSNGTSFKETITAQVGKQYQYYVITRCVTKDSSGNILSSTCADSATDCPGTKADTSAVVAIWGKPDKPGGSFSILDSALGTATIKNDLAYWPMLSSGSTYADTSTSQTNTQNTSFYCDNGSWPQYEVWYSYPSSGGTTDTWFYSSASNNSYNAKFGMTTISSTSYASLSLPLTTSDAGGTISVKATAYCVGGSGILSDPGPTSNSGTAHTWTAQPPAPSGSWSTAMWYWTDMLEVSASNFSCPSGATLQYNVRLIEWDGNGLHTYGVNDTTATIANVTYNNSDWTDTTTGWITPTKSGLAAYFGWADSSWLGATSGLQFGVRCAVGSLYTYGPNSPQWTNTPGLSGPGINVGWAWESTSCGSSVSSQVSSWGGWRYWDGIDGNDNQWMGGSGYPRNNSSLTGQGGCSGNFGTWGTAYNTITNGSGACGGGNRNLYTDPWLSQHC